MKPLRLFGLLGALYFAQGLPFGFFTQALPVMLRQAGASLEGIGLTSLLALPWALKFLVAPRLDRTPSRRRWLLALQLGTAALLVVAAFVDALPFVLATALLVNAFAATQDIATDGLAVELVPRALRGFANGLQVGAYRVGMVVGGGVLLMAFDVLGWRGVFLAMAGGVLSTTLPVLRWREAPRAASEQSSLKAFFTRADVVPLLGLLFLFKFGEAFGVAMLKPRLVDLGVAMTEIGFVVGTVGFFAGLVGAVVGGALVGVLGRRRALLAFGSAQAGSGRAHHHRRRGRARAGGAQCLARAARTHLLRHCRPGAVGRELVAPQGAPRGRGTNRPRVSVGRRESRVRAVRPELSANSGLRSGRRVGGAGAGPTVGRLVA
ncbi:MAG: MFS transporter [Myxococcaceae bacterium]|nr:MFS transporter [Myxococcaceae bacterium]